MAAINVTSVIPIQRVDKSSISVLSRYADDADKAAEAKDKIALLNAVAITRYCLNLSAKYFVMEGKISVLQIASKKKAAIMEYTLIELIKSVIKKKILAISAKQQDSKMMVLCCIDFSNIILSLKPKKDPNIKIKTKMKK